MKKFETFCFDQSVNINNQLKSNVHEVLIEMIYCRMIKINSNCTLLFKSSTGQVREGCFKFQKFQVNLVPIASIKEITRVSVLLIEIENEHGDSTSLCNGFSLAMLQKAAKFQKDFIFLSAKLSIL